MVRSCVAAWCRQPVPLGARRNQRRQRRCGEEAAIDDAERMIRNLAPQLRRQRQLRRGVGAEAHRRQQMRAQRHQRHHPHQRIAAVRLAAPALPAERRAIVRRVGHAHRRPVEAIHRQPAPGVPSRRRVTPLVRAALEDPAHRLVTEPRSPLHRRARRHSPATAVGQRQLQMIHDRHPAVQRHPQHEPDRLLRRQPPAPHCRGACRRQRLLDPLGRKALDQPLERQPLEILIRQRQRHSGLPNHAGRPP